MMHVELVRATARDIPYVMACERRPGYESWLPLGSLQQFPENETRFATYRNPVVNAWDGETATIACWVRRLEGDRFQVFVQAGR